MRFRHRVWPVVVAATSLLSISAVIHASETSSTDHIAGVHPAEATKPSKNASAVTIRDVQLERADPIDDMPTATLTFDVHNTIESSVTDVVVGVSVLGAPAPDGPQVPTIVVRPFTIRLREVLLAGSSIRYELRLRNLSSDCTCTPKVGVMDASILSPAGDQSQSSK